MLYFLTISAATDSVQQSTPIVFFTESGSRLAPSQPVIYQPDAHLGELRQPVVLMSQEDNEQTVYKIIEDDKVIIIRNGERFDIFGRKAK